MKKLSPKVMLTDQDNATLERIRARFLREGIITRSLRDKNLSRANNRYVVIDYGSFRFAKSDA